MLISRPRIRKEEERILPLVNIVFLLLIFFMIAGELAARDDIDIAPPTSSSETPAPRRELVIQMPADGRIFVDGEFLTEGHLEATLRDRLSREHTPNALFLKADAAISAERVVAVLEYARSAGFERVKLLTVAGSGR